MKKKIAVLPGDGVGPEVIDQAVKVLDAVGERFNHQFEYCYAEAGVEAARTHGAFFPETTISTCLNAHAVLAGPLAHGDVTYSASELSSFHSVIGQFVQYLPLRYYASTFHLSMLKYTRKDHAENLIINGYDAHLKNRAGIDRFCRYIYNIAGQRKKSVVFVQTGSLKNHPEKWEKSLTDIAKQHPRLTYSFESLDNTAQRLLYDELSTNLIITLDEAGHFLHSLTNKLYGTTGLLPRILVGQKQSIFQTTQGEQEDQAGEDTANPFAMLHAASLLLHHLDLHQEAALVEKVVDYILDKGIGTTDLNPNLVYYCSQIGDIAAHLIGEGNSFSLRRERIRARMSTII